MDSKAYKMNIIDEAMSFDEFNLYWKKILISGGLRALERGDEFDWNKTLQFISNRNNYTSWEIEKDDKYWEFIRGVYNRKFNTLSKDTKDEKEVINNELWIFCFNALKNEFWNKKCNEVNEIEQSLGIKKSDKS
ncbi:hypothetical protein GLOIN_2v1763394 [Rhizophagus irregularis DAOM 181602=DAOM 197198]|uniref:Uncharacterized protein n=1 Tax=Rhizophagus irregularis (strain DAOM 181602 / DAOM 197198 / MUCL 43194) TaxID=747089 RepID=A0A2P4QV01_RHIID|nr:hypothetical protein GLOIN_2v1763394 [Rhizophagus irregularis DAOM 181602=DAOM 197198]POG81471.1 hypothetical protein GLOIN_2v1763394 [Rhizophagus irregularis DAOM 181602=DAOM 197198]|eukprot:XP_025188337.1 hypothetical protein GLOIN_2v1763394 [Rhizophagus irregularis DAOM 181602=DAOM 197198]